MDIEGIQNIQKHYRGAVKNGKSFAPNRSYFRGKKNRKLTRLNVK